MFTAEMLEHLLEDKRRAEAFGNPGEIAVIERIVSQAQKLMNDEYALWAVHDTGETAQKIETLHQLREFGKVYSACSAYLLPSDVKHFSPKRAIDIGDFGAQGTEAGCLLAYLLPYEGTVNRNPQTKQESSHSLTREDFFAVLNEELSIPDVQD